MGRPKLTMALSLYDRHIPFFDGTVSVRDIDIEVLAVGESNPLRNWINRHYRMLQNRSLMCARFRFRPILWQKAKVCR